MVNAFLQTVAQNHELAGLIIQFVGGVVAVIGLAAVFWQLRAAAKETRLQAISQLLRQQIDLFVRMTESEALAEQMRSDLQLGALLDNNAVDSTTQQKWGSADLLLWVAYLYNYQNMFLMNDMGVLSKKWWTFWENSLGSFTKSALAKEAWPKVSDWYHPNFQNKVEEVRKNKETNKNEAPLRITSRAAGWLSKRLRHLAALIDGSS